VSVAHFSTLAHRYGDDLAILWIDSHPDIGTPASRYPGFHAMAVAALTGHGDADVLRLLPGTVSPDRVALVGLHEWTEDDFPNVAAWGIWTFSPDDVRQSTQPLLDWLAATGCSRVAIHVDVDTVDSNEIVFGLGAVPDGLGFSTMDALAAATSVAAHACGVGSRKGRLAPGFDADILAVAGDPTTDVRALLDVRAVFRAGRRV
jgi:arginase